MNSFLYTKVCEYILQSIHSCNRIIYNKNEITIVIYLLAIIDIFRRGMSFSCLLVFFGREFFNK